MHIGVDYILLNKLILYNKNLWKCAPKDSSLCRRTSSLTTADNIITAVCSKPKWALDSLYMECVQYLNYLHTLWRCIKNIWCGLNDWFSPVLWPGSCCPASPPVAPAPPGGWAGPSSACPASCAGSWEEADAEGEDCSGPGRQNLQSRSWRCGSRWRREAPVRASKRPTVAGWAACCVSSGGPRGTTSSGSARLAAAGSAPAGSGSAERPPVRGWEDSQSGPRSSVDVSAPSRGANTHRKNFTRPLGPTLLPKPD